MNIINRKNISTIITISMQMLVLYIIFENSNPFGITKVHKLSTGEISEITPTDRVIKNSNGDIQILDKYSYFETNLPKHFDTAVLTIKYNDSFDAITAGVGHKTGPGWNYNEKIFENSTYDFNNWFVKEENPTIISKTRPYDSVEEALDLSTKNYIGSIGVKSENINTKPKKILDYKPSDKKTIITTHLRGKHTLYMYLENEIFEFKLSKRDLNWYEGADKVRVDVIKDTDLVYSNVIEDDGNESNNKQSRREQTLSFTNPGPELPESGVYKVVINANDDTIITEIETNLEKVVFESPIFPVDSASVYGKNISENKATEVYTKSDNVSALIKHKISSQEVTTEEGKIYMDQTEFKYSLPSKNQLMKITAPKSNLKLYSFGYFTFDKASYFEPYEVKIVNIAEREDLLWVDTVLSNYNPPINKYGYKEAIITFDLSKAYLDEEGNLRWRISIPTILEKDGKFIIKDIEIKATKEPITTKVKEFIEKNI